MELENQHQQQNGEFACDAFDSEAMNLLFPPGGLFP